MLIGYARVSKHDQNAALQVKALTAAGCERIFIEKISGLEKERSQLRAALRAVRKGDTLVVWKLDRLGRSLIHLVETIEALDRRGVGFHSITEAIDTTTASGRFLMHVLAALAEFERAIIWERTMAGLDAAREQGRVGGRPRKLTDADIERARSLLESDAMSVPDVARTMGVSVATLYARVGAVRASLR